MAEFEKIRGQVEGLWNTAVKDVELQGRKAGAAAAAEAVWQAGEKLAREWDEERAPHRTYRSFLEAVRQCVGSSPLLPVGADEMMTEAEWERRRGERAGRTVDRRAAGEGGAAALERARTALAEQERFNRENRVYPQGAVVSAPYMTPAWAAELDRRRAAGIVDGAPGEATAEELRQADLERERLEEEALSARVAGGEDDSGPLRSSL